MGRVMRISDPKTSLIPRLREVWEKTTCQRISQQEKVRPYWSEADVVSHLMSGLENDLSRGKELPALANVHEVDWHVQFSLKPNLFAGTLSQNIRKFGKDYGLRRKPDLVLNEHNNISDPFLIHGEAKVWFGGDWQPTLGMLRDDLKRLEVSNQAGVCDSAVMIVVYDPLGDPVPKGVDERSICRELQNHQKLVALTYPTDLCKRVR